MTEVRRPYVKIEDGFARHPKIVAAGPLGLALQVAALSYANEYRTDGVIPAAVAATLLHMNGETSTPIGELLERMVAVGLWEETEGGYRIHDYLKYQRSREEIEAVAAARAEAGRKGGKAKRKQVAKQTLEQNGSKTEAEVEVELPGVGADAPPPGEREVSADAPPESGKKPATKPRRRDVLWDALALELGEPATRSERGKRNDAAKQLREAGATGEQVRERCAAYRRRWPDVTLTDQALVKHWTSLGAWPAGPRPSPFACPECGRDDFTSTLDVREHREREHGVPAV